MCRRLITARTTTRPQNRARAKGDVGGSAREGGACHHPRVWAASFPATACCRRQSERSAEDLTTTYIVDIMSCYVDIGDQGMVMGPGPNQVTVNPGVREDALDAFLSKNNRMLKTVTAGELLQHRWDDRRRRARWYCRWTDLR